jgi:hypothetical protein
MRVLAALYRPLYAPGLDGFEFDAPPCNDAVAPAPIALTPQSLVLLPASNYPFPAWVRVLRGLVRHAGAPVANALVGQGATERVLTDSRGAFSLPLRWVPETGIIPIDATPPAGPGASVNVTLPAALSRCLTITL